MRSRLKLGRPEKLRRNHEFKEVYMRGRRIGGPHLSIFFKPNQLTFNRLGLSVAKKRFKLSVRRYYVRRRLREAYRLNKAQFLPGHDIAIVALRYDQGKTSFRDINKELLSLAQKAGLLKG